MRAGGAVPPHPGRAPGAPPRLPVTSARSPKARGTSADGGGGSTALPARSRTSSAWRGARTAGRSAKLTAMMPVTTATGTASRVQNCWAGRPRRAPSRTAWRTRDTSSGRISPGGMPRTAAITVFRSPSSRLQRAQAARCSFTRERSPPARAPSTCSTSLSRSFSHSLGLPPSIAIPAG